MNIYIDMVGDLFHYGHTNALKTIYDTYIKNTNNKLVVGVHNDKTVESYKRKPILTMDERIKVISTCKYIYKIIPDADFKFFITANAKTRALRRYKELKELNKKI